MTSRAVQWRSEMPGILVAACATIVYLALVPPYVMGGDNGEFALLAHADGIAHPPGYPLYVGLLRVLRWLPAASPVQAAGYATALMASLQMLALYAACRAWRIPVMASAIAVGFYAGSPLAIQHLTHAEVFALNGLLIAAILAVCSPQRWLRGAQQLVALAALCGLGFTHHHSFVLMAPLIAYGAWSSLRAINSTKRLIIFFVAFSIFLLTFALNLLLVPWSQSPHVYLQSWGVVDGWHNFWRHFLRLDYGTFHLSGSSRLRDADLNQHLLNLLSYLNTTWKFLLPLAGLAFIERLRRHSASNQDFWAWLALLLCFIAAGPLFFSRANINPIIGSPGMEVLQRFYLLPCQLLTIPIAQGLWLSVLLARRFSFALGLPTTTTSIATSGPIWTLVAALVGMYAFGFNALISIQTTKVNRESHTQDLVKNGLDSLPQGAILVVRADDEMFAGSYLQEVEHFRPDITLVNTGFLQQNWYIPRLSKRLSDCKWPQSKLTDFFEYLIDKCDKKLFITVADDYSEFAKELYRRHPNYQYGLYRQVLAKGSKKPSPDAVFDLNQQLFSRFKLPQRKISLGHGWASWPSFVYASSWKNIARDMEYAARPDLAALARQMSIRYGYCKEGACLAD